MRSAMTLISSLRFCRCRTGFRNPRVAHRFDDAEFHARMLDAPFAGRAVMLALAEKVIHLLFENRQHVVPAPALEAELAPVIVVGGLASHIDHGVDRG